MQLRRRNGKTIQLTLIDFTENDYARKLGLGVLWDAWGEEKDTYVGISQYS